MVQLDYHYYCSLKINLYLDIGRFEVTNIDYWNLINLLQIKLSVNCLFIGL